MASLKVFLVLSIVFAAAICRVQSEEIEVNEGDSNTISCPANHGINIDYSEWKYKFFNVHNTVYSFNYRNLFYLPGYFLGSCTYDATEKIKELCFGRNECVLAPTKDLLNGCSYEMFLKVYYWCQPCEQSRKRRGVGDAVYVPGHGVLFVGGVCNLVARLPGKSISCPNSQFVGKHACLDCADTQFSAEMFAHQVRNMRNYGATVQTSINTVFVASGMTYHQSGSNCVFGFRAAKYDCHLNGSSWSCTRAGDVIASHNMATGHYIQALDT